MQSVAHNGFGCPYCRTKMAEEPQEEETCYDSEEEDADEEEMFDEDTLRGFRFFWNNINGDEHDVADVEADEMEDEEEEEVENVPTANFVAEKLRLNNVSYEDLVKVILLRDHDEYQGRADEEQMDRLDGEIFVNIRIIVSNYSPEQAIPVEPVSNIEQSRTQEADFAAQPKTPVRSVIPRFMTHV
jgi:hypothetical protein